MDDFEQFVAGSAESLLRTAHLITWDAGEAEDLVQECLIRVARRWTRVRRMQQPLAYARRVLINLAVDGAGRRTRRRRELGSVPPVVETPAQDVLAGLDTREELLDALAQRHPASAPCWSCASSTT